MDARCVEAGVDLSTRSVRESHDAGLATIDRYVSRERLRSDAADALDEMVRERDQMGIGGRYL